jgi:long-chain acyl-CoA synthetase
MFSMASWLQLPESPPPVLPEIAPDNLAVLIYTSGTTGRSKGVMLSHRNILADAHANTLVIEAVREDVFVTASPLFHVFGFTNVMLTGLLAGGTLVLIKRFSPSALLEAITRYRVTFLAAVPTMYQMMLTLLPSAEYDLSSLRVCHSGAAPMPVAVFERIEALFGAPVQEGYGQSEASSIMTSNPLYGVRKPGSIGMALHGLVVEIADDDGQSLPPNAVGELRLQGDTVMLGYWNNPKATENALRDGWLYTSDMGYFDEDGYLFLVGRKDDMINVGGAKVYPREVEEALYQHPEVASCAVCAELSELYGQIVVAYVVTTSTRPLSDKTLQAFCEPHLAAFKIPKAVYFVEDIPKGPTGKILRHLLKPPVTPA